MEKNETKTNFNNPRSPVQWKFDVIVKNETTTLTVVFPESPEKKEENVKREERG